MVSQKIPLSRSRRESFLRNHQIQLAGGFVGNRKGEKRDCLGKSIIPPQVASLSCEIFILSCIFYLLALSP